MATCRSCGAPVYWASTEARDGKPAKSMPLDATDDGAPLVVAAGNIVLLDDGKVARYVPTGKGSYVSHFATCKFAASHRRKGR